LFEFPVCVAEVLAHPQAVPPDFILKILALAALVFQEFFIIEDGVLGAGRRDILSFKRLTQKLFCRDLNVGRSLSKSELERASNARGGGMCVPCS
jgi:hypothetical protein